MIIEVFRRNTQLNQTSLYLQNRIRALLFRQLSVFNRIE
jgi:hypothetical protein